MKLAITAAFALVAASTVIAQTCDNSTGYYIDPSASTDGSTDGSTNGADSSGAGTATSGGSLDDGCNGDLNCEDQLATLSLEENEGLNAIAEEGAEGVAELASDGSDAAADSARRSLVHLYRRTQSLARRQTTFSCDSSQTCIIYGDLSLCVDSSTGEFTDATGGNGNLNTGEYNESAEASSILSAASATAAASGIASSTVMKTSTDTATSIAKVASSAAPLNTNQSTTSTEVNSSASPTTSDKPSELSGTSGASVMTAALITSLLCTVAAAAASLMS